VNRFVALVGSRYPLQQAGMSGPARPELAAAVSNAGGLGMLGVGRQPLDVVERFVSTVATLTSAPVGATMIAHFVRPEVEAHLAEHIAIVEFFYQWPDPARVRSGVITGWQIGSLDEAKAAADAGCSYVVAQGVEAGGHVRGTVPLAELIPAVREALQIPIVAAGGIGSADAVRAALAMGADAVRVGTRFVASAESAAHPDYVEMLVRARSSETEYTEAFGVGWPNAPHRVLTSSIAASEAAAHDVLGETINEDGRVLPMPRFGVSVPVVETTGDIAAMALYAGTSVDHVTGRPTAAQVVAELVAGCGDAVAV
jgi:nitronate monooxygenase